VEEVLALFRSISLRNVYSLATRREECILGAENTSLILEKNNVLYSLCECLLKDKEILYEKDYI
jgi:hypothetical protein